MKPSKDDRLRRFASLGYVIQKTTPGLLETTWSCSRNRHGILVHLCLLAFSSHFSPSLRASSHVTQSLPDIEKLDIGLT